jgi:hypothetical protein
MNIPILTLFSLSSGVFVNTESLIFPFKEIEYVSPFRFATEIYLRRILYNKPQKE